MRLSAAAAQLRVKQQRLQFGEDLRNFLNSGIEAYEKAKEPDGRHEHPSVDEVKTYWTGLIGQEGHYDPEEEGLAG